MSKIFALLTVLLLAFFGGQRQSEAATITTGGGWLEGLIGSPSDTVSFEFTLSGAGVFSLTDCCALGDTWSLAGDIAGVSKIGLSAITVPLGVNPVYAAFDDSWTDVAFTHFQMALAAGSYSFTVMGDCGGTCPAEFGVRADLSAVPLPAAGSLLLAGLAGLGVAARRRRSGYLD